MKHVPIREYKFPNMDSAGEPDPNAKGGMYEITCINHQTAKYLTKNPFSRGLHFVQAADGFWWNEECPCGFDELVVVCHD